MERESVSFHQRVRKGFLSLAGKEPKRFLVADASQSKAHVAKLIEEKVHALF